MPAHIVYGDSFLVAEQVRNIKRAAGAGDLMDSNRHRITAAQARPDELVGICNSLPFLDTLRLVELEGALATQESAAGGGRGNSRNSGNSSGNARAGSRRRGNSGADRQPAPLGVG